MDHIPPDGLRKGAANIDDLHLRAALELVAQWHGVRHDQLRQAAVVYRIDGVAAQNTVCRYRNNLQRISAS